MIMAKLEMERVELWDGEKSNFVSRSWTREIDLKEEEEQAGEEEQRQQ